MRPGVPTTIWTPLLQGGDLPVDALPAVDRQHLVPGEQADLVELLGHLHRELAGRTEHQRLHGGSSRDSVCAMGMPKAAVLPVPVWAWPEQVPPLEHQRDGLLLDGSGLDEAHLGDGVEDGGGETELVEISHAEGEPPRAKERCVDRTSYSES